MDDDAQVRESVESLLKSADFGAAAFSSAEEALERIAANNFEVVLLDVWLPGIDGMEALGRI